jgi:glutaminyl-peptide cyclotransferase
VKTPGKILRCEHTGRGTCGIPGLLLCLMAVLAGCACSTIENGNGRLSVSPAVRTYTYRIINVFPHDPEAFTEGLVFDRGFLYEGTGLNGKSSIRKIKLDSGQILLNRNLPEQYFGEGIVIYKDSLIQLTWTSGTGFVFDVNRFNPLGQFSYPTEGWGITHDQNRLIMSDGTSTIYFWDPVSYAVTGRIEVRDNGRPVDSINELEYIKDRIYANIWKTDRIAIIDPQNGRITGWVDLTGLLASQNFRGAADVLNGIAYDEQADRLFVTGKLWPLLFEIKLVASPGG